MKKQEEKKPFDRCKAFGVFIVDDEGVAVRCFNERRAARGWLEKHRPELRPSERNRLIRTFGSYRQVRQFFDQQIRLGCSDSEVLALMTYYCGVSTSRGFDLKNGHTFRLAGEKPGGSAA